MVLDKRLLDILCCPVSHQALLPLDRQALSRLNAGIAQGAVRNRGGEVVPMALEAALVTSDRRTAYPIVDGIPALLPDAGIALAETAP
jgi:uncharacterized protein